MAIIFTAEGGFLEVPDPPKPPKVEWFQYLFHGGPSTAELFKALKFYPERKIKIEIQSREPLFHILSSTFCEVSVYGIRVLLAPMDPGGEVTVDRIEDHLIVDGFAQTSQGFQFVQLLYHTKERTGSLSFSIKE